MRTVCAVCAASADPAQLGCFGAVRGNTRRFRDRHFRLWRCPDCGTVHALDPVDPADIYRDYPAARARRLDWFARRTLARIVARLRRAGLRREHRVLDYGCGGGLLATLLAERGHADIAGFDPHVAAFATPPVGRFDCVVCTDVIEHVEDPRSMMAELVGLMRPGGLLYVGTAGAEGLGDMADLDGAALRLHQPFHRVMPTLNGLRRLGADFGLAEIARYRRAYLDTPWPFANYRFLRAYSRALGDDLDRVLDPASRRLILRRPRLLLAGLFGYAIPPAFEPAVVWRARRDSETVAVPISRP